MFLLLVTLVVACTESVEPPQPVNTPKPVSPQATIKPQDKLDVALRELVRAFESGGQAGVKAYGKRAALALVGESGDRVEVEIICTKKDAVPMLAVRVKELGGTVITDLENTLYASLPVESLKAFAGNAQVWTISIPKRIVMPFSDPEATARITEQPMKPLPQHKPGSKKEKK